MMAQATTGILELKYDAICRIAYAPPFARGVLHADKGTCAVQALFNSHTSSADSDWLALATHALARYFHPRLRSAAASSRNAFLMRRQAARSYISQPRLHHSAGLSALVLWHNVDSRICS